MSATKIITITDADGEAEQSFVVEYIRQVDSHCELEGHLRFTEQWDEIQHIFDDKGNPVDPSSDLWTAVETEFDRQP